MDGAEQKRITGGNFLLAVSFTHVYFRLAFICWKGQHYIVFGPFQRIKANCKQPKSKTNPKQTVHSAFGVLKNTPASLKPDALTQMIMASAPASYSPPLPRPILPKSTLESLLSSRLVFARGVISYDPQSSVHHRLTVGRRRSGVTLRN